MTSGDSSTAITRLLSPRCHSATSASPGPSLRTAASPRGTIQWSAWAYRGRSRIEGVHEQRLTRGPTAIDRRLVDARPASNRLDVEAAVAVLVQLGEGGSQDGLAHP